MARRGPKPGSVGSKARARLKKTFTQVHKVDESDFGDIYVQAKEICKVQVAVLNIRSKNQLLSISEAKAVTEFVKTALMLDNKKIDSSDREISEESLKQAIQLLTTNNNEDNNESPEDDSTTKPE